MEDAQKLLYEEVERYVDEFHKQLPLFKRDRNLALVHILRCFEDHSRMQTARALLDRGDVPFFVALQNSQDSLVWAIRWIWTECPHQNVDNLGVDWDIYGEAAELYLHCADYYHLYRCIVLCRRGYFTPQIDSSANRIRFVFRSEEEKRRDIARQLRETKQDATHPMSDSLSRFIQEWAPLMRELFPCWMEKTDDYSVKYELPPLISWVFARWASLQSQQMEFSLPGKWQFGNYTLDQFRTFWKSLLAAAIPHSFAHMLGDDAADTKGFMTGSVILQLSVEQLEAITNMFPLPIVVRRSIISEITYDPTAEYWDPIWQPIFRINENNILISPSLLLGSSAERNLIALLNKKPKTRELYHRVSLEKETEQLSEIETLFTKNRFLVKERVQVKRKDGNRLSDADLLIFDLEEDSAMVIQAKWLLRPDFVTEVVARDDEMLKSLSVTTEVVARVIELGSVWLSQIFGQKLALNPSRVFGVIVNRDFLPSGWVNSEKVPIVDDDFLRSFTSTAEFSGLESLYEAARQLDERLATQHASEESYEEIQVGKYAFEFPASEI